MIDLHCSYEFVRFFLKCICFQVDEDDYPWIHNKTNILEWLHKSLTRKSELAQCIATAMVGPRTWIGGIFSRTGPKHSGSNTNAASKFTPVEEARYQKLHERADVPYDEFREDHQKALEELWNLAYPNVTLTGLISEQWKEMGWQGVNPSTDFRSCGFLSLENLLFFAKTFPNAFRRLLLKQRGKMATWEYPFAVAGINISFMLTQMLELYQVKPNCRNCINFVKILGEDEEAFDVLYCIAFVLMDAQWIAMHASYMEFNDVLKVTRTQLERELALEDIHRIRDLPAFNLLHNMGHASASSMDAHMKLTMTSLHGELQPQATVMHDRVVLYVNVANRCALQRCEEEEKARREMRVHDESFMSVMYTAKMASYVCRRSKSWSMVVVIVSGDLHLHPQGHTNLPLELGGLGEGVQGWQEKPASSLCHRTRSPPSLGFLPMAGHGARVIRRPRKTVRPGVPFRAIVTTHTAPTATVPTTSPTAPPSSPLIV
ncbi:hypothetical protein L1987_06176 [Smallanthus sonchifolius]|uniref:Uncharacterized protein n=1 Tax=Smallanthus sonchifolius TaxID=185202 RepID=A0ACB9JXI0_9ASTR|nr:hypothetical protein L1987_06176 [Smallanthus sonchifolius]